MPGARPHRTPNHPRRALTLPAAALAALLVVPTLPWVAGPAAGDSTLLASNLPTVREAASAAWSPAGVAYVFGGYAGGFLDKIVGYTPSNGAVQTLAIKLPTPRSTTAAVWDTTNHIAYVFGGSVTNALGQTVFTDQIVRVNPAPPSPSATVLAATLPSPRTGTSAVWDPRDRPAAGCAGGCAYVFGGYDGSAASSQVVQFNPSAGTVSVVASLSGGRSLSGAVWDPAETVAYVFGDNGLTGHLVERFDPDAPAGSQVTTLSTAFPSRSRVSAAWDPRDRPSEGCGGGCAYVFGGYSAGTVLNEIVQYNPSTNTVKTMPATFTSKRWYTSAVGDGAGAMWVFGGGQPYTSEIVRYRPELGPPRSVAVTAGVGIISLSWLAPDGHDHGVTAYRVHRSLAAGGPYALAAEVGSSTLSFTDSGLPDCERRYYRVSAVNATLEGTWSDEVSASPLNAIGPVRDLGAAPGPGTGEVALAWQPPSCAGGAAITNYRIYRATSAAGPYTQIAEVGTVLTFTDTGVPPLVRHWYRARAVNAFGSEGPPSGALSTCSELAADLAPCPT